MGFNKFRKRNEYYDPYEPATPIKPAPPTPQSPALEGTIAYKNVQTQEAYKTKIDTFSEILAALEAENESQEGTATNEPTVQSVEASAVEEESGLQEKYERVDIQKVFHEDHSMSWDIGYREYLLGVRVVGELYGAWIQKDPELFSDVTYEPFFILFGRAYEHGVMGDGVLIGEGVNFEEVRFLFPGKEFISTVESLEKFLAEGGEGNILYLRFKGIESVSV